MHVSETAASSFGLWTYNQYDVQTPHSHPTTCSTRLLDCWHSSARETWVPSVYHISPENIKHLMFTALPNICGIWIKRDQLDITCFIISLFNAQHVSDVNTYILRSSRLICWVISWVVLLWFDACWCYAAVWLGWCGIRVQAAGCIRIPHHPSQTTT